MKAAVRRSQRPIDGRQNKRQNAEVRFFQRQLQINLIFARHHLVKLTGERPQRNCAISAGLIGVAVLFLLQEKLLDPNHASAPLKEAAQRIVGR